MGKAPSADVLFGGSAGSTEMDGLREIPLDDIRPGENMRRNFDETSLDELALSIREHGVLQPVVVVADPAGRGYVLVAGERRWRASQLAGRATIPAVVRDLTPQEALEAMLVENLQRADLDPIEEAVGLQRVLESGGYTQSELAAKVGKSQAYIANRLRLLRLPEEVRRHVSDGELPVGHALQLLRLENSPEFLTRVAHHLMAKKTPATDVPRAIEAFIGDRGMPLTNWYGWRGSPRFDLAGCDGCVHAVQSKAWGGDARWCLDEACWRAKQEAAEAARREALERKAQALAADGQPVVSLAEFEAGDFVLLEYAGFDPAECRGCRYHYVGVAEHHEEPVDACTNRECFYKKREAFYGELRKRQEAEGLARRQAELGRIGEAARARAARGWDRDNLLDLATWVVLACHVPWRGVKWPDVLRACGIETDVDGLDGGMADTDDVEPATVRAFLAGFSDEQVLRLLWAWPGAGVGLHDAQVAWLYGVEPEPDEDPLGVDEAMADTDDEDDGVGEA